MKTSTKGVSQSSLRVTERRLGSRDSVDNEIKVCVVQEERDKVVNM
jgi:hypothetical protein